MRVSVIHDRNSRQAVLFRPDIFARISVSSKPTPVSGEAVDIDELRQTATLMDHTLPRETVVDNPL